MRYSPSTGGFYPESIDYPNLPEDLITITDEEHQAAINKPAGATLSVVDDRLVITLPPEKTAEEKLAIAYSQAIQRVNQTHAQILSELTGNVTPEERDTWPEKVAAAKESVAAGEPTQEAVAVFQREASALGQTIMQRCQRSLQLRGAYLNLVGLSSGFKTELEVNLKTAKTPEEIETIMTIAKEEVTREVNTFKQLLGG